MIFFLQHLLLNLAYDLQQTVIKVLICLLLVFKQDKTKMKGWLALQLHFLSPLVSN